ncbi:MAG: SH3 domain-containing protein [Oscillospiraceae bacterium]|nr:SH3 domain-containing protein [Candidatus Ruminococcus equi]
MKRKSVNITKTVSVILALLFVFSSFAVSSSALVLSDEMADTGASLSTPKISKVTQSGSFINFEWNAVSGAYAYRVFYKNGVDWKTIAETKNTSFLWNGGTYGKDYVFTVRCVDEKGNYTSSFDSNGYAFSYLTDTPKISSVVKSGSGVKISWSYVSGAYAYKVFYKNGVDWKTIATTSNNSYTWTSVTAEKEYIYTVRCVNSDGDFISSFDKNGYAFTYSDWDVAMPKISSISNESNAVRINWGKVTGTYAYKVFYKNGVDWKSITTTTSTTFLWNGAVSGKQYTYTVRCVDKNGDYISAYDKSGYDFTLTYSYLSTPKISSVTASSSSVKISWAPISGAYAYKVFYKNGVDWKTIATTTSTSYTWTSVIPDREYIYTVRCVNSNDDFISDYDHTGYAYTLSKWSVSMPKITSITKESNAVRINWGKVSGTYGYKVFYKNGVDWKTISTTTDNTFLWNGAVAGREYTYTVRCVDSNGDYISTFDSNGYDFTLTYSGLSTPKISSVTASGSSVKITWSPISGAYAYKVFYKNGVDWKTIATTTSTSYTWSSPFIGREYIYTVRCVNSAGEYSSSFDSTGYKFTLNLATPKITSITQNGVSVNISWGSVSGAYAYRVFYKNGTDWKGIGDTTSNSFRYDFASIDKEYIYTVRCIDTSGNFTSSFDSNGYAFTTKSYYSVDTPKITSITQSGINLKISWNGVKGATKYRVFYKNGADWKTIETVSSSSTSYTWSGASADRAYTYTVRCVDSNGDWQSAYDPGGYTFTAKEYVSILNSTISVYKYSSYKVKTITNSTLIWSSSNSNVATVVSGVVSGQESGTCTISCKTKNGTDSAKCTVTVTAGKDVYLSDYSANIPAGKSFYCKGYTSGISWSTSDSSIATVSGGFIKAVNPGVCVITASISGGAATCVVNVSNPAPIRFAYTSPNCAAKNADVTLIAITDNLRSDVRFSVNLGNEVKTVYASSHTSDGSNYIWKGKTSFSSAGTYNVTAYSKYDGAWSTCNDATTTAFVTSTTDYSTTVCANRRASDEIIDLIANYEGFLPNIYDDPVAPGNWTLGYGRVIYPGEDFYNNLTKKEAYAYLVQTVNNDGYSSNVNKFLVNNGVKFNQRQFDALVCFAYNCGTGPFTSDSDLIGALLDCSSGSSGTTTYYCSGSDVNFRSGPGTSYSILDCLSYNTPLKILSTSNSSWYYAQLNDGTKGYISSTYVGKKTSGGSLDLNYVNKQNLIDNFCAYHHAGDCLYGLLYRRVDEMEVFFYGDYDRNYGTYKYNINYTCYKNKSFHT